MNRLYYLLPHKQDLNNTFSNEKNHKVILSLVNHVYMQTTVGMIASFFCASIIFIGLFDPHKNNTLLFTWAAFFLIVTIARVLLCIKYKLEQSPDKNINYWRNLYILGALLGGFSWGFIGIFLLPNASAIQQTLMVLMLAGVTAGAIPLSAGVPYAAIAFLVFSILPFIISIALLKNNIYRLFDAALSLYLVYTIILTIKSYDLIKNSIILKFENDILLYNLELINKKLEHAATHDPLTHIGNRRLFNLNLKEAIRQAGENKKLLALLYIDLDNFKSANDKYGHRAGDHILITIIERLKNYLCKDDIIARLGGDELAVIIENVNSMEEIEIIANKICQLIAMPIKVHDINLKITASIGISIYPYDGNDEDTLLRCSDDHMYVVKEQGGNNFYFSKESVK